jgi:hypothetical protein
MTPKIIPVELRNHLAELAGNELKVWMCYLTHANDESTAFLSDKTLGDETGLSQCTIQSSKKSLREKHWLGYTGDVKQGRGNRSHNPDSNKFDVPVMRVLLAGQPLPKIHAMEIDSIAYFSIDGNLGTEGSCSGCGSNPDGSSSSRPSLTGQNPPAKKLEPEPEPKAKATAKPEPPPAGKIAAEPPPAKGNGKAPHCILCDGDDHWQEDCTDGEVLAGLQRERERLRDQYPDYRANPDGPAMSAICGTARRLTRIEANREKTGVAAKEREEAKARAEEKRKRREEYYSKHPEARS